MSEHDARLAPGALLSLVGCALVVGDALPWAQVAGVLGLAAVLALAAARWGAPSSGSRAARGRTVAVATAFTCAVAAVLCWGAGVRHEARVPPAIDEAVRQGAFVVVEGTVTTEARPIGAAPFTGGARWAARVTATRVDQAAVDMPVSIVVAQPDGLDLGREVVLWGRLSASRDAREAATMWDARVRSARPPGGAAAVVGDARDRFRAIVRPLPPRLEGLVAGMVIGDDSAMPPAQREEMRRSGLAHLTAVSGAHFAVLSLVAIWLARRSRAHRAVQAVAVAAVGAGFTLLVGPEPSVVRAAAMAAVMALALALGRRARALAALSAGVLALLAVDPWVATSLGFCLSVAAVAGIAVWSPHVAARLERWLVPRAARLVAIPIAAGVATAPLLVSVAGGIGVYSVPANVLAAPFAAPVTLLGLLAVAVAPMAPGLAHGLVSIAALAARPVDWAARAFANAPGAWLTWPDTAWGAVALAVIGALLAAATVARRVRGWGLAAGLLVCVVALATPTALGVLRAPRLPEWDVIACDVGQGDMMLLRSAPDAVVVIDVGPRSGASAACLARHGVHRVELLVITHPHADHDGDLEALLGVVRVDRAWVSPAGADASSARLLEAYGVPVEQATAGMRAQVGGVSLRVLAPDAGWVSPNDNDASVVVVADAGGASVLALGDLESEGQERLLRSLPAGVIVDVVKVAHHGSADQSASLASRITARVGVVSVGEGNSYGHPAARTLELYGARTAAILRTDECGDILIAADPGVRLASRCPADVAG